MSYRFLDHATDAIVEVTAKDLKEAFSAAADAVINLTIDQDAVRASGQKEFSARGRNLEHLLFSWLEEVSFVLVTEGFAIRSIGFDMVRDGGYLIRARAVGEPLDLRRHNFKVEVKAPTFHEMQIRQEGGVFMRFLLDL